MPRFDSDPIAVSASQEIYPAADYEFVVRGVTPFVRMNEDQTPKNWGVNYRLEIAEGPLAGKKYTKVCYDHTEGSKPLSKAFVMACMGYPRGRTHEARFNDDFRDKEWFIDTDANEVGDGWQMAVGQRVVGTLAERLYNGEPQQEEKGWRPVGA